MTLNAMFALYDNYTSTITKINKKTEEATVNIDKASVATDKLDNKLDDMGATTGKASNKIDKATGSTRKLKKELKDTGSSADSFSRKLGKIVSVTAIIATINKGISIADEYTNASSRLSLVNDGLQTQLELQNKIFASADRSKGLYMDMASAVSKLGLVAKDSFSSTDEIIAFTELLQKSFKVGGASQTEQSAAMLQLSQAMGSGALKGDEFNSISENAPLILEAVANFTGKSRGELKDMASEGMITSDIIKNAMFNMSDEINKQFATMPMTFADVTSKIKNKSLQIFDPVIKSFSRIINSDGFNNMVNVVIVGISIIAKVIGGFLSFIQNNGTLIMSVLGAIAIYLATTMLPTLIATGVAGLKSGLAVAAGWALGHMQMLMIIGAIALLLFAFMEAGLTIEDIFGFIGGVIGVTIATINNLFLGLGDIVLGVLQRLINPFITFTNFLGNIFTSPISSVIYGFQGMADNILGIIQKVASALDFVFGSKMSDTVGEWRSGLKSMADEKVKQYAPNENYQEIMSTLDYSMSDFGFERMNVTDAYNKGSDMGKNAFGAIGNKIGEFLNLTSGNNEDFNLSDFGTSSNPLVVENKDNEVNIADEDLRYMRDIAEREYVNKFKTTTLAPNITNNFGDIRETADLNDVKKRLEEIMRDEIAVSGEG